MLVSVLVDHFNRGNGENGELVTLGIEKSQESLRQGKRFTYCSVERQESKVLQPCACSQVGIASTNCNLSIGEECLEHPMQPKFS